MIERHPSVLVETFVRVLVPLAQLFGLYVLAHGHVSPGGGFQAGVIIAATYILQGLAFGRDFLDRHVSERVCGAIAAGGALLYLVIGAISTAAGATFLDFSALPLPGSAVDRRYLGILLIETGVTAAVAATLILIFCRLGAQAGER
jgi:multicomponent Na+:H+ antiporter subunit B